MILRGRFIADAPYFPVYLRSTFFQGLVWFLADTGASRTILLDRDRRLLGIPPEALEPALLPLVGIGGSVRSFLIRDVALTFVADQGDWELRQDIGVVQHDLRQLPPDEAARILRLPSVLGRDLLNRFSFTCDYQTGIVQLDRKDRSGSGSIGNTGEKGPTVAGVDGCPGGWMCFFVETGRTADIEIFVDFATLISQSPGPDVIAIDVPIGLTERSPRACDIAARRLLGKPRSASVFPAPPRSALRAQTYEEACRLSREATGKALSRQTFGIIRKIEEVDTAMNPKLQNRVFEVHPEVSFWALNNNHPMRHSKSSKRGQQERLETLLPYYPNIKTLCDHSPQGAAIPDVLDAAAAAWTAERIAKRSHSSVSSSEGDNRGLRMEILY